MPSKFINELPMRLLVIATAALGLLLGLAITLAIKTAIKLIFQF